MSNIKIIRAPGYTHYFDRETGFSARWGDTKEENPTMCPLGPEILDIEISAGKCSAKCGNVCYKSNSPNAKNEWMPFDTFKTIIDKVAKSKSLCQCALGITDVSSNPSLFRIMEYCRSIDVIPNITVNGFNISDDEITKLANVCGAVAVSHYNDQDCFGTVERLTKAAKVKGATLRQINIHQILCAEKYEQCREVIRAMKIDERLKDCNAVVLMTLKPKGWAKNTMTPLNNLDKFQVLFKEAIDLGVPIGFDSCGAPSCFKAIERLGMENIAQSIEACEIVKFSSYINVFGDFFPCSFSEGEGDWKEGLSVLEASDFTKDIWYNPKVVMLRNKMDTKTIGCQCSFKQECRPCFLFDIMPCFKK